MRRKFNTSGRYLILFNVLNIMLTYKFIVTHRGRLGIRLRNNNKKTELALPRLISRDELDEVLSGQPKKSESAERRNLRLLVSQYSAYFERLSAQILADGNMKIDVMEVRADFEKHFGLVEETEKKNVGTFVAHFQKFIDGKDNKDTEIHISNPGAYNALLETVKTYQQITEKYQSQMDEIIALLKAKI